MKHAHCLLEGKKTFRRKESVRGCGCVEQTDARSRWMLAVAVAVEEVVGVGGGIGSGSGRVVVVVFVFVVP